MTVTTRSQRPPPRLIGRDAELEAISAAFAGGARLVVLTGPPGVGKTRLTTAWASSAGEGRGVVVNVSDVATAEAACARLARDVGVSRSAAETPDEVARDLSRALASSGVRVLVLDSVDRLLPDLEPLASALLAASPRCVALATSRQVPEGLDAVVLAVEPLPVVPVAGGLAPAVELLLDRAGRSLDPDEEELAVLSSIAREVDGLPLALELAAARLPVVGAGPILAMLRRHHPAALVPLHRAVADAIASLDPVARQALLQASVFRGGFSFEAAETVIDLSMLGEDQSLDDALRALVAASLLASRVVRAPVHETRYDCLAPVRDVAFEMLVEESADEGTCIRHADYYLTAAVEWARDGRPGTRERLSLELENLVTIAERALGGETRADAERGLRAVLALEPLLWSRGPLSLFVSFLDRALTLAARTGVDPVARARAIRARWDAVRALARARDVLTGLTEATRVAAEADEPTLVARIEESIGEHQVERGRLEEGLAQIEAAVAGFRAVGDAVGEARASRALGRAALVGGDGERAERALLASLAAARRAGSAEEELASRLALVRAKTERRDVEGALAELREARRMAVPPDNVRLDLELELASALVEVVRGAPASALPLLERSRELARGVDERLAASVGRWLAMARAEVSSLEVAIDEMGHARLLARDAGLRWVEARALSEQASWLARRGDFANADLRLSEARDALSGTDLALDARLVSQRALEVAVRRGDPGARERAARAPRPPTPSTFDEWRALSALDEALGQSPSTPASAPSTMDARADVASALLVGPEARWARPPEGERIELATRGPLRRILGALIVARRRGESSVRSDALLAAGWPDERILPDAASNRLYVAIATLRKLGLRDVLVRFDDGWRLDPDVPLIEEPD